MNKTDRAREIVDQIRRDYVTKLESQQSVLLGMVEKDRIPAERIIVRYWCAYCGWRNEQTFVSVAKSVVEPMFGIRLGTRGLVISCNWAIPESRPTDSICRKCKVAKIRKEVRKRDMAYFTVAQICQMLENKGFSPFSENEGS